MDGIEYLGRRGVSENKIGGVLKGLEDGKKVAMTTGTARDRHNKWKWVSNCLFFNCSPSFLNETIERQH